jgi:hypothetical protein
MGATHSAAPWWHRVHLLARSTEATSASRSLHCGINGGDLSRSTAAPTVVIYPSHRHGGITRHGGISTARSMMAHRKKRRLRRTWIQLALSLDDRQRNQPVKTAAASPLSPSFLHVHSILLVCLLLHVCPAFCYLAGVREAGSSKKTSRRRVDEERRVVVGAGWVPFLFLLSTMACLRRGVRERRVRVRPRELRRVDERSSG